MTMDGSAKRGERPVGPSVEDPPRLLHDDARVPRVAPPAWLDGPARAARATPSRKPRVRTRKGPG